MGKSSLANTLIGYDNLASLTDKKVRKRLPFKIGHGLRLDIFLMCGRSGSDSLSR